MNIVGLRLVTGLMMALIPAASRADDEGGGGESRQAYDAKLDYCKTCHGLSGEGYRGYYPIPRLAGQQTKYIGNQLRAFIEGRRVNPVMSNVARVLTPAMIAAVSSSFNHLTAAPAGGAPKDHLALGKMIYEQGVPKSNVPACSACHGSDGKGREEIPRLAGQLYPYTVKALIYWSKERNQNRSKDDTAAIMAPIAHNLSREQMAAVAAYVSYMK